MDVFKGFLRMYFKANSYLYNHNTYSYLGDDNIRKNIFTGGKKGECYGKFI